MSRLLSPAAIAELALRRIGVVPSRETAAEGQDVKVALAYLDMIVSELAGTETLWWLRRADRVIDLVAGTYEYDMAGLLDPDADFFRSGAILDDNGDARGDGLELLLRDQYEALGDRFTRTGEPTQLFVERASNARAYFYPIPDDAYRCRLYIQEVPDDLRQSDGGQPHGAPEAWQRYLHLALAYDIGSGPVRALPPGDRAQLRADRDEAKYRLVARNLEQNVRRPRIVAYRDL